LPPCSDTRRSTPSRPQRGADADLAIWDPERKVDVTDQLNHDALDYCPYAGMTLQGWPTGLLG
jgi:dihydropyrimidinase